MGTKIRLGDAIHFLTKYTGIKYLVKIYHKHWGTDCGCDGRRKKLNEIKIERW